MGWRGGGVEGWRGGGVGSGGGLKGQEAHPQVVLGPLGVVATLNPVESEKPKPPPGLFQGESPPYQSEWPRKHTCPQP